MILISVHNDFVLDDDGTNETEKDGFPSTWKREKKKRKRRRPCVCLCLLDLAENPLSLWANSAACSPLWQATVVVMVTRSILTRLVYFCLPTFRGCKRGTRRTQSNLFHFFSPSTTSDVSLSSTGIYVPSWISPLESAIHPLAALNIDYQDPDKLPSGLLALRCLHFPWGFNSCT